MFRRPAPGRPARQCGHPKSHKCDCLSTRTLCCILSSEEWDLVENQHVVTVEMYDTREALDDAQAASSRSSVSHGTPSVYPGSEATPMSHGSFSTTSTPALVPRLQMFGVGGPQGNAAPGPDAFAWSGEVPQMQPFGMTPQYQTIQPSHQMPQSNPQQYPQLGAQFQPQQSGMSQVDMHRGSISHQTGPLTPWPQPRPEYMPFNHPQLIDGQESNSEALRLERMHIGADVNFIPQSQTLTSAAPPDQFPPSFDSSHFFQTLPATAMQDFAMDTDLSLQRQFDPSQPPAAMENLSQSCCSSKRQPPQPMHSFESWQYPGSAPTQQFPCARCASTQCTCTNCPEVMQDFRSNGAWSRACGRDGHLDANEGFPAQQIPVSLSQPPLNMPPAMTMQQPMPPTTKSCCGGGSSGVASNSGPSTGNGSPFIQPRNNSAQFSQVGNMTATPQWHAGIPQTAHMQHPSEVYTAGLTLDPQMLFQTPQDPDWNIR